MEKNRLEAFSDGVIAIIITIMVLELKVPHVATLDALKPLAPVFISYILSFINVGIYWNNHHHLIKSALHISGSVMWANHHLLFWLSMIPFGTAWMGENHFAPIPVAVYGGILCMAGVAYSILVHALIKTHEIDSQLAKAIGKDAKGNISILSYLVSVPLALWSPLVSCLIIAGVALLWLIPDRRLAKIVE